MNDDYTPESGAPEPALRKIAPTELREIIEKHRVWLETEGTGGAQARLNDANLGAVNLGAANLNGALFYHSNLQKANLSRAKLQGANLSATNLEEARLDWATLQRAWLRNADLRKAILWRANLEWADLSRAKLQNATLDDSTFRDADLTDADLQEAKGLHSKQLAGAIVSGAELPDKILSGFTEALRTVEEAARNARKLLFGLLVGCVYSWLTIVITTDALLLTNTASSPLPIIGTAIPIAGFFWAAPLLLLAVFLYMQLSLQRLWELLAGLPSVFPDGVPLDKKAYPWLLIGCGIRSHVPRLRDDRPLLARLQTLLSTILAWWVVPFTMLLFWLRYLPRHHWLGTTLHIALVVLAVTSAVMLQRMARKTLRGETWQRIHLKTAWKDIRSYRRVAAVLMTAAILLSTSRGAINGSPDDLVPRAFSALGYNVFTDISGADLGGTNLMFADLTHAVLTNARLTDALLEGANLTDAILIGADLAEASLLGVNLTGADLTKAVISQQQLNLACGDDSTVLPTGLTIPSC